jgi:hypothetical protein
MTANAAEKRQQAGACHAAGRAKRADSVYGRRGCRRSKKLPVPGWLTSKKRSECCRSAPASLVVACSTSSAVGASTTTTFYTSRHFAIRSGFRSISPIA